MATMKYEEQDFSRLEEENVGTDELSLKDEDIGFLQNLKIQISKIQSYQEIALKSNSFPKANSNRNIKEFKEIEEALKLVKLLACLEFINSQKSESVPQTQSGISQNPEAISSKNLINFQKLHQIPQGDQEAGQNPSGIHGKSSFAYEKSQSLTKRDPTLVREKINGLMEEIKRRIEIKMRMDELETQLYAVQQHDESGIEENISIDQRIRTLVKEQNHLNQIDYKNHVQRVQFRRREPKSGHFQGGYPQQEYFRLVNPQNYHYQMVISEPQPIYSGPHQTMTQMPYLSNQSTNFGQYATIIHHQNPSPYPFYAQYPQQFSGQPINYISNQPVNWNSYMGQYPVMYTHTYSQVPNNNQFHQNFNQNNNHHQ